MNFCIHRFWTFSYRSLRADKYEFDKIQRPIAIPDNIWREKCVAISFRQLRIHSNELNEYFFYFDVCFCVVFYFDWLWHLQSAVRAPFTSCASFIYFYILFALCLCTNSSGNALSVCAHTVVSLVNVNVTVREFVYQFHYAVACIRSHWALEEWMKWIYFFCGGKRTFTSCEWIRQTVVKCVTEARRWSAVRVSKQHFRRATRKSFGEFNFWCLNSQYSH